MIVPMIPRILPAFALVGTSTPFERQSAAHFEAITHATGPRSPQTE